MDAKLMLNFTLKLKINYHEKNFICISIDAGD